MTPVGLEFQWDKYDVAPGAEWPIGATIPWTDPSLLSNLNPAGPEAEFLH